MKYYYKLIYKLEAIVTLFIKYISLQKLLFLLYGKNWFAVKIGKNFTCLGKYKIDIKNNLDIGDNVRIQAENINFGNNIYIGHNNYLFGKISIDNNFMSGPNVSIMGGNHMYSDINTPMIFQKSTSEGINIGSDVWIGANSIILDGVNIASHCIIAGGSVLTKDTKKWGIYGGNPAKIIGNRLNNKAEK